MALNGRDSGNPCFMPFFVSYETLSKANTITVQNATFYNLLIMLDSFWVICHQYPLSMNNGRIAKQGVYTLCRHEVISTHCPKAQKSFFGLFVTGQVR